jgi:hypothetical protein
LPKLRAAKVLPTFEDRVAIGRKTVTDVLSKTILQPWLVKGPKSMRAWRNNGMTWPDIVDGESAETEATMALATENSGHLFATVMPTVRARGL